MKKLFVLFTIFISFFAGVSYVSANCAFDPAVEWQNISDALANCLEWDDAKSKLVKAWNVKIWWEEPWFKDVIQWWVQTLGSVLAILAVGAIVYGSLLLVLSGWEEEKLKKWKDVVKWSIVWFLWVIFAGVLITIVVNVMFSL